MEPDLDRLGHLNLIEFCRELTRWSERGVLHEEGGVLCFANGGTDFPVVLNGAHRVDPTADAAEVVARAQAFFGDLGRGFSLQLQVEAEADIVEAAAAAGLHELMGSPEMLCHGPLPEPIPGDGVELRPVTTTDDVAAFIAVQDAAYQSLGMPAGVLPDAIGRPDRMLNDHTATVVAYVDGEPMAGAQTIASHGIAGVYFVGTKEEGRGRGLGELVTAWVTNAGFAMGGRVNTLQASHMGEPIYRRMGYEERYRYVTYADFGPSR